MAEGFKPQRPPSLILAKGFRNETLTPSLHQNPDLGIISPHEGWWCRATPSEGPERQKSLGQVTRNPPERQDQPPPGPERHRRPNATAPTSPHLKQPPTAGA